MQLHIMEEGNNEDIKNKEKYLLIQLNKRCEQEEIFWRKKYRVGWLKQGEKNMTFFHHSIIQHKMKNKIIKLHSEDKAILEEHEEMIEELTRYFSDLLNEPNPSL